MIYPAAIGLLVGTLLLTAAHAAHRRLERHRASAMSAGTAETTQIGSGLQPASAAPKEGAR